MPFDVDPAAYVPAHSQAYADRWCSAEPGAVPRPRKIEPRSDAQALLDIWHLLETRWSPRLYNDGANHCIVGWVGNLCCPSTIATFYDGQPARLLDRLHDALPKSAQRKTREPRYALAKYNDTHSKEAVRAVVHRAYLAEVNAQIDKLNSAHPVTKDG